MIDAWIAFARIEPQWFDLPAGLPADASYDAPPQGRHSGWIPANKAASHFAKQYG